MAEVLSQSEIDALLAAVSTGEITTTAPVETETRDNDWIAYDLTSHEKVVQGRFAGLKGIHERFVQSFRATLTRLFKRNVSVTVASTETVRFSEHTATVSVPSALNVISMNNLKGHLLFEIGAKFTYAMVDAYYGGAERPYSKIGAREEFTTIESMMIRKVVGLAIGDLQEAWRPNFPIELEYKRVETNPNFVGVINQQDSVVVVTMDIDFDNMSGSVSLVLPIRHLERIEQELSVNVVSFGDEEFELWEHHWLKEIRQTELDVRVELGTTERTLNALQDLKRGDVLALDQDASGELKVLIQGQAKVVGLMGTSHGNSAVRITEFLRSIKGEP